MNYVITSFIITFISGFSTMIGTIIIFLNLKNKNNVISSSLIFSSSIMLYLSIFDLIPEAFNYFNNIYLFIPSMILLLIYTLFGGLLVRCVDRKDDRNNSLYKVGIISFFALILHNIPEGIITYISINKNFSIGLSLAISIALHNIPEGIAISVPLYYGKNNKKKAILYTFIAALSEPFGAVIAYLFLGNINDYLFAFILSVTAGIMIYLSIFELIKEVIKYNNKWVIFFFFLGFFIMIISKIII